MSTWLITGSSTGFGRSLAQAVLAAGHNVVASARNPESVADLVAANPDTVLAVALDVTDRDQITRAVAQAEERFGAIDVVVNNAGYGYRAAVEEGDEADVARLFDTHVFGPIALIKAVLPAMRARHGGSIVNISSIAALSCPPGSGYYAAAKAALEGISGSLRKELSPLGIDVVVVAPGQFRTDFHGRSLTQSAVPISDYAETAGKRRIESDSSDGNQPGDPELAARAIITAVESDEPPALLMLGNDAMDNARAVTEARIREFDTWEQLSRSTSYQA